MSSATTLTTYSAGARQLAAFLAARGVVAAAAVDRTALEDWIGEARPGRRGSILVSKPDPPPRSAGSMGSRAGRPPWPPRCTPTATGWEWSNSVVRLFDGRTPAGWRMAGRGSFHAVDGALQSVPGFDLARPGAGRVPGHPVDHATSIDEFPGHRPCWSSGAVNVGDCNGCWPALLVPGPSGGYPTRQIGPGRPGTRAGKGAIPGNSVGGYRGSLMPKRKPGSPTGWRLTSMPVIGPRPSTLSVPWRYQWVGGD